MNWWQRKETLAQFGAVLLLVFYVAVIAADFVALMILMTLSQMDRYYHQIYWGI